MSNWVGNLNEQSLYEIIEQLYEITNEDEPHERFKELYESCLSKLNENHTIEINDENRLIINITDGDNGDKVFIQKDNKTDTRQTLLAFDKIYYTERITAQLLALLIYKIESKQTEKPKIQKITQQDLDEAIGYIQKSDDTNPVIQMLSQILTNLDNKNYLEILDIESNDSASQITITNKAVTEAIYYIKHFNDKNIIIELLEAIDKQTSNHPDINITNILHTVRS